MERMKKLPIVEDSTLLRSVSQMEPGDQKEYLCKKTFKHIFAIKPSKKVELLVRKKKSGDTVYKDKRGGVKSSSCKFTFRNKVKD